jgi:hypothetical protein
VFDGGQVLVAERVYGLDSAIRLFPFAVVVAILSVFVSRYTDLSPGVVYGFIAAAVLMPGSHASSKQEGIIVALPMLAMVAVSCLAWLALAPLGELADRTGSIWSVALQGAAAATFIGGIQGVFFNLIPLDFMDGKKILAWNKAFWLALVLPVTFVFFHLFLNPDGPFEEGLDSLSVQVLFGACIFACVLAGGVWYYFHKVRAGKTEAGVEAEEQISA